MYSTDSCSPHTSWPCLKLFHYATVFTKLLHNAKRVKSLSCSLFYNSFASKHNALAWKGETLSGLYFSHHLILTFCFTATGLLLPGNVSIKSISHRCQTVSISVNSCFWKAKKTIQLLTDKTQTKWIVRLGNAKRLS